ADAAHGVEQQRAAAWVLFGDGAKRRGPEKGFSTSVERGGGEEHRDARAGMTEPIETDRGGCGTRGKQAKRRNLVHDRSGAESQHEHNAGGIDEEPGAGILTFE